MAWTSGQYPGETGSARPAYLAGSFEKRRNLGPQPAAWKFLLTTTSRCRRAMRCWTCLLAKCWFFRECLMRMKGILGEALGIVFEAIENYQPERYGYRYADDVAPRFNFGSSAENGAKMAVPVMSLDD